MPALGLIGGTGVEQLPGLTIERQLSVDTPYGKPSSPLSIGEFHGRHVVFLQRHGEQHEFPPHRVNYRANLRSLRDAGVSEVIAFAAVGGIARHCVPGTVAIPHQIIDYSWGRESTFWDLDDPTMRHIEFDPPFDEQLRGRILDAARASQTPVIDQAVYGVTQGPRLETAAEISRMARDGCDLVGMTVMPEAALARELQLPYVSIAMVINSAAGLGSGGIHADIDRHLAATTSLASTVLEQYCRDSSE